MLEDATANEGICIERDLELPLAELQDRDSNPRIHTQPAVERLAKLIEEVGFQAPIIVDEHNKILAGHKRKLALRELGRKAAPAIRVSGLSESQKAAVVIADNQHTLSSGWDFELLGEQLVELEGADFELDLLGFPEHELKDFMDGGAGG